MSWQIHQITSNDIDLMRSLLLIFGKAFDEIDTYGSHQPSDEYLRQLLGGESFLAIALYIKLGVREDVLHFDIAVSVNNGFALSC